MFILRNLVNPVSSLLFEADVLMDFRRWASPLLPEYSDRAPAD